MKIDKNVELPLSEGFIQDVGFMKANLIRHKWFYAVGKDARYFVMGDPNDSDTLITCINPIIVDHSPEMVKGIVETCNDHPGLVLSPKRYPWIKVRYTAINGNTDTIKFSGLTSVLFQHCMDHLDGIQWTSRVSSVHLDIAKRKMRKRNGSH
jgi:peptide deformylase